MVMKYVSVVLSVAAVAAITVVGAWVVAPQEAEASLYTVKTCGGGTIKMNGKEKRLLNLHNKVRAKRGLKALCVHRALTKAARAHSQEMLDKDYMSHNSYNGETLKERLVRFGYRFSGYSYYFYGENIAWGSGSGSVTDSVFRWWMNSRDHRSNILDKRFRQVGIGARTGTYKTYTNATIYTVDFGVRRR